MADASIERKFTQLDLQLKYFSNDFGWKKKAQF